MKTLRLLLTLSLAGAAALFAADKQTPSSRVEVTFTDPEKFTDVKDSYFGSDKGRDATLEEFRDFITKRAEKLLPEGQKLSVNFTDIDLAGDYEPWRGPRGDDIRIVKDIYPPRLKFSYKITDAAGAVIKEEKKEISDLSFQMRLTIDRQDPISKEKDLLSDWMKKDLRAKK